MDTPSGGSLAGAEKGRTGALSADIPGLSGVRFVPLRGYMSTMSKEKDSPTTAKMVFLGRPWVVRAPAHPYPWSTRPHLSRYCDELTAGADIRCEGHHPQTHPITTKETPQTLVAPEFGGMPVQHALPWAGGAPGYSPREGTGAPRPSRWR